MFTFFLEKQRGVMGKEIAPAFFIFLVLRNVQKSIEKKIYSLGIEMLQTLHSVRNYGELKENNARTNRL